MRREKWFALITLLVLTFSIGSKYGANSQEPIARLVFNHVGGGIRPDIALFIAYDLKDIGIEVVVKVEEWSYFPVIPITHDYDIGIFRLGGGGAYPGAKAIWMSDGSLNIFGLGPDIPYQNESEEMQMIQETMVDPSARQTYLYEWQNLVMDKIIPILPLFTEKGYNVVWANTLGYDVRWGLRDSLPYMSYDGYHSGQDNLTEFNFADANWVDLNPLFSADSSSSTIASYLFEPILQMNPDFAPVKTGLVSDWDQIDETHFQFWMMDDVYWNPSYNSTARDDDSIPLGDIPAGEYMVGLKDGLPSTGTSHQVTAKDAVFTYLTWANSEISDTTHHHDWISDCYVDPVDELSFHIHIDGNPETVEIEPYADMWAKLTWEVLPEFFLNSTDPTVTYTEGGVECTGLYADMINTPEWIAYSTSAFGCGPYSLDYRIKNYQTVLKRWDGWHGRGAITGETGLSPFIDTITVRIIPDLSAELAEFEAGRLDIADITTFTGERKMMQADQQYLVNSFNDTSMLFMAYNLRRPFIGGDDNFRYLEQEGKENYTKACAVRKAINYAIDRDEINQVFYDGESFVSHSVIYPSQPFYYYNDIIKYNYDLDTAIEWLEAAGYYYSLETNIDTGAMILTLVLILGISKLITRIRKRKIGIV